MAERMIELISEQSKLGEIEDLILDDHKIGRFSKELKDQIENLPMLLYFSLNNCGMDSLENFPLCKGLLRLELIENSFPAKDLRFIQSCQQIQSLSLSHCKIKSIEALEFLKQLPELI